MLLDLKVAVLRGLNCAVLRCTETSGAGGAQNVCSGVDIEEVGV